MTPTDLFKALADETRTRISLLIAREGELCVCELTAALGESQPKISRHLALLRNSGLLVDRRQGQWIYYRFNPQLPEWVVPCVLGVEHANRAWLEADFVRLCSMGDRPRRQAGCC